MELSSAMELGRSALWMTVTIAAPILVIGLVIGMVVAFFQAVTQLQEQSLTFVPKIGAMVVAAAFFIPWIAERMLDYARDMLSSTPW